MESSKVEKNSAPHWQRVKDEQRGRGKSKKKKKNSRQNVLRARQETQISRVFRKPGGWLGGGVTVIHRGNERRPGEQRPPKGTGARRVGAENLDERPGQAGRRGFLVDTIVSPPSSDREKMSPCSSG